jgi:hypothetical protein
MAKPDDAERDFERIFGKVEKSDRADVEQSASMYGATQKLPSDSDLLGIRTDSDRFIMRNPLPERLPIEAAPPAATELQTAHKETGDRISRPAAPTIGVNEDSFASIRKPAAEKIAQNGAEGSATQLFGRNAHSAAEVPSATAEFRRVPDFADLTKVPKPFAPAAASSPPSPPTLRSDTATKVAPQMPADSASGPSDFTRIVKGSELRALQEKLGTASGGAAATPAPWPGTPVVPNSGPSAGMATQIWSASSSSIPQQQSTIAPPWPPQIPNLPPAWKTPELPTPQPSKLSQYMPLILVLNLLFLLAILLVVFFALKK